VIRSTDLPHTNISQPPQRLFGAHLSIAGGHERAVEAAADRNMTTVQIFTKSTQQWVGKPLRPSSIAAFRRAVATHGIERPVAHASYLINLGSPDPDIRARSIDALACEVERCDALGIEDLVFHPGAHLGDGERVGLERVAQGVWEVLQRTQDCRVRLDLETTAGQGTCLGGPLAHLEAILQQCDARDPGDGSIRDRLAVCCDTCHLYAFGYDLVDPWGYHALMEELATRIGLERVRVWHLNDSARECGSRVDRHAGIGRGRLGLEPFRRLVNEPAFLATPLILETPKGTEAGEDLDLIHLRTLRGLLGMTTPILPPTPASTDGGSSPSPKPKRGYRRAGSLPPSQSRPNLKLDFDPDPDPKFNVTVSSFEPRALSEATDVECHQ